MPQNCSERSRAFGQQTAARTHATDLAVKPRRADNKPVSAKTVLSSSDPPNFASRRSRLEISHVKRQAGLAPRRSPGPVDKFSASTVKEDPAVFVWLFHRISGILLVVLLPLQIGTGILQGGVTTDKTARLLHGDAILNTLLAFLVIFHGLYGLRTILLDLGLRWEKGLFWICTLLGVVLFAGFLYFFFVVAD